MTQTRQGQGDAVGAGGKKGKGGAAAPSAKTEREVVRVDAATAQRVEAARARYATAAPHMDVKRSDTVRALILRGLDAEEAGAARRGRRAVPAPEGVEEGVGLGGGGPIAVGRGL